MTFKHHCAAWACAALLLPNPSFATQQTKGTPILISNPLPSDSTLQYVAVPGKTVQKGELLFVVNCTQVFEKLNKAQEALSVAEAEAKAREKELAPMPVENAAKLAAANHQAAQAERALRKYVEGEAPANELGLQLVLIEAQSAQTQQQIRFDSRDKLLQEGFIQKVEYDAEEVRLKKTKLGLEAAKIRLETFVKFERDQITDQLEAALKDKKAAVQATQTEGDRGIAAAQATLEAAKAKLQSAIAECERLKELLHRTAVTAPAEGEFSVGDPSHPEVKMQLGGAIGPGEILGVVMAKSPSGG
ncbi:MAG: hypothetical protein WCP06_08450 [Verrucomicrobiota bacterium]